MVAHLVKTFPSFCRTRRFVTMFTVFRYWTLSWSSWMWFRSPHPFPFKISFNVILPSALISAKWSLLPFRLADQET